MEGTSNCISDKEVIRILREKIIDLNLDLIICKDKFKKLEEQNEELTKEIMELNHYIGK